MSREALLKKKKRKVMFTAHSAVANFLCGKQIILTSSSFPGDLTPSDEASLSKLTAGQVMNINLRSKKCSGQSR